MIDALYASFLQGSQNAETLLAAAIKLSRHDVLKNINYKADLLAVEAK
jgi:hypothetical protein